MHKFAYYVNFTTSHKFQYTSEINASYSAAMLLLIPLNGVLRPGVHNYIEILIEIFMRHRNPALKILWT